jgi:hypothetical protein
MLNDTTAVPHTPLQNQKVAHLNSTPETILQIIKDELKDALKTIILFPF